MRKLLFTILVCFIVVVAFIAANYTQTSSSNYALRPTVEVVNWNGNRMKIKFPYQDYKYILDYSNPYEYIKTDAGYDLVIHFGRFERGEN